MKARNVVGIIAALNVLAFFLSGVFAHAESRFSASDDAFNLWLSVDKLLSRQPAQVCSQDDFLVGTPRDGQKHLGTHACNPPRSSLSEDGLEGDDLAVFMTDFYASTCTCPDPDSALAVIRSIGQRGTDEYNAALDRYVEMVRLRQCRHGASCPPMDDERRDELIASPASSEFRAFVVNELYGGHKMDEAQKLISESIDDAVQLASKLCSTPESQRNAARRIRNFCFSPPDLPGDDIETASQINAEAIYVEGWSQRDMRMTGKAARCPLGHDRILLGAPMLAMAREAPESFRFMVDHEIGHLLQTVLAVDCGRQADMTCFGRSLSDDAHVDIKYGEIFADWTAAELESSRLDRLARPPARWQPKRLRKAAIEQMRWACELGGAGEDDSDPHPSGPDRINRIWAAHPSVRALFGAPSDDANYCPIESVLPPH